MKKNKDWTIIEIISWTTKYFQDNGIENGRLEVEWLLCHLLSCERIDLYLQFENKLNKNELNDLKNMITRRISGEPFQHIIEKGTFYGRDFFVNSNVLIPRPETELIIDRIKKKGSISSILDVGTGCGCIAITCVLEKLCNNIFAIDISKEALNIAKENAAHYNVTSIKFKLHDFLNDNLNKRFDIILSNPPYIELKQMKTLPINVKKFEPYIALTDYKDGLSFYHRFANSFNNITNKNGCLILEINNRIKLKKILDIFHDKNLQTNVFKDLQNDNRVVEIYK